MYNCTQNYNAQFYSQISAIFSEFTEMELTLTLEDQRHSSSRITKVLLFGFYSKYRTEKRSDEIGLKASPFLGRACYSW